MIQTSRCPACLEAFELIADGVDGNVLHCPRCGTNVPVFNVDTCVPSYASANNELVPSEVQIAGYEIRQPLGQGGMGLVLEGCQVSLGRRVAIKFLMPSLATNEKFVERFEREAAALASLSHPNIVTIFERGRTPQGFYFIMEYVEGPGGTAPLDLRALLNQRRLTPAEVKQFVLQVVKALAYAHEQGIVHRDIKPGNVMIDRHGNAKVADFGIASIADEQERIQLTAPSGPLGTFDYMAPEQRDNATQVDQRADVYSVGVMLYEMLTGELPRGAFQPPSRIIPELNVGWDEIVELTLQSRPENRLGDMETLAKRIDSIPVATPGSGKVAGAVEASESSSHTSVPLFCAECGAGVSREARFCPACRAKQWAECSGCQKTIHASLRFCPSCGIDVQSFRMLQKYLETARLALTLAQDSTLPPSERCHQAQQAGLAAARAVKYAGKSETSESGQLLTQANECYLSLARQAGEEAYKKRRYGEARFLLEQILQIQPGHAESITRLDKIQQYFLDRKSKAEQLQREGHSGKAANVLEKLIQSFPDDETLVAQLEECRRNHQQVEEVVQRIIPALKSQNKWYAVRREIIELQKAGIEVQGLSDYAVAVDSRLAATAPGIRKAQNFLSRGSVREATQCAEEILHQVADHPRALEIIASAKQMNQEAQEFRRRLQAASDNGDWFHATAILSAAGPAVHASSLGDLKTTLQKGCRQANNFARLELWSFLGAGLMIAGTKLLELLMTGMEDLLTQSDSGPQIWQTDTVRTACLLGFSVVIAIGSLILLRAILQRPVSAKKICVWSATGLAGAAFFLISHVVPIDIINPVWILHLVGLTGIGLAAGLIAGLASRDVVAPPMVRLAPSALAGMAAVLVVQFCTRFQDDYTRFLTPAVWLSSLLLITRISSNWLQASAVILAGLAASVLAVGLQRQYENWSEMTLGLLATTLLAATGIVAGSNRCLLQIVIVSGISCCVFALHVMLPPYRPALTLWWLLAATTAQQVRGNLDPRLHIIDRVRARRTVRSKPMNSGGRPQEENQ